MRGSTAVREKKTAKNGAVVARTLGEFIRLARKGKGMTLDELARRAEITQPFLSDIERGRRNPSEVVLIKLAQNLGIDIDELDELNTVSALRDLKLLLDNERELRIAFTRMIKALKQGKITPGELVARLSS